MPDKHRLPEVVQFKRPHGGERAQQELAAVEFFEALQTNHKLNQTLVKSARTPDAWITVARNAGYDFAEEDLASVAAELVDFDLPQGRWVEKVAEALLGRQPPRAAPGQRTRRFTFSALIGDRLAAIRTGLTGHTIGPRTIPPFTAVAGVRG